MSSLLPVVLGSSAASRRAVLVAEGVRFSTMSPDIDEGAVPGRESGGPSSLVLAVAGAKLEALLPKAASLHPGGALLVCCDQVVVGPDGAEPREKPKSEEEALANMRAYSGATASCVSGVVVCDTRSGRIARGVAVTTAHLQPLSDADMDEILRPAPAVTLPSLLPLVVQHPLPAGVASERARTRYGTLEEHGRAPPSQAPSGGGGAAAAATSGNDISVWGCAGALCIEHPAYARRIVKIDGDAGLDGAHGLPWTLLLRLVGEAVEGKGDDDNKDEAASIEAGLKVLLG
jgi:predicted house-cleaning NTP pyrophosphatase (Maf/HAM1 superfamily)